MKGIIIGILILFSGMAFSQVSGSYDPERYIAWNEFYDLSWDDFKGSSRDVGFGDAGTAIRIAAKPYLIKKEVYYEVYALFDRKKSWAGDVSESLLRHERLHFDLAEVYARRVRKKVQELRGRGERSVAVFNSEIKKILKESNQADEDYDRETMHGAWTQRQQEWELKINEALISLENYGQQKRIITSGK